MRALPIALPLLLSPTLARGANTMAGEIAPVFIVGTVFGAFALMLAMVLYAIHRAQVLRHETLRRAIEKGAPLPPELLSPARRDDAHRDLRRGLVLVGLGGGLGLFLGTVSGAAEAGVWTLGFVPGLLGAGYLVTWLVARRDRAGASDPAP